MSPLLSLLLSLVLSDSPKSSPRPRHRREARRRFAPRRPRLEVLEDRALPSAYVVTTTADGGPGSLRDAINQVNADTGHALYASPSNPSVDEIDFNITAGSDKGGGFNAGTGVATMTPQSALPTITNAVLIDGYTQAGASGNSNPFGHADNAVLKIELDGAGVANGNGLGLMAPNITVCGLVINRFTGGAGIALYLAPGAWVYGNYIGVDPTGESGEDNGGGVAVTFSDHVTVGANGDGVNDLIERNLISGAPGYGGDGIYITGSNNVTIQGNYLGTDAIGNVAIANQGDDIRAQYTNSQLRIIGNVISGDGVAMGITLVNTTSLSGVVIQGNRIGTNAAGTAALGDQFGIELEGNIQDVHIGGTDTNTPGAPLAGAGNLISGNYNGLVSLDSANVTIQGNYVGTDVTGSYAIPNVNRGMVVGHAGSQNITIGGVTAGTGNLVSGNALAGINIVETAGPVLIEGNTVGTDAQGEIASAQSIFRPRVDFSKGQANDSPGFRPVHGGETCPALRILRFSIVHHFANLTDPRLRRCRRHQLLDIIALAICGVICGCKSWGEIAVYGRKKADWLQTFLELPGGIPSKDTFRRVFARIKPAAFQACFRGWMQALAASLGVKPGPTHQKAPKLQPARRVSSR